MVGDFAAEADVFECGDEFFIVVFGGGFLEGDGCDFAAEIEIDMLYAR